MAIELRYNNVTSRVNFFLRKHFSQKVDDASLALDLGAGAGGNSRFLIDRGYRVISFDISKEAKKIAGQNNVDIILKDIRDVDVFSYKDIQLVLCNYVLQNFSYEGALMVLNNVFSNLRNGVYFLVSIFEQRNYLDREVLARIAKTHNCVNIDADAWQRLDQDHGPAHYHIGYDALFRKVSQKSKL